jgi:hypothetical protein
LRRAGIVDFSEHTDTAELEWRLRQIKITDQEVLAQMQAQQDKTFAEYFEQWWRDVNQWRG